MDTDRPDNPFDHLPPCRQLASRRLRWLQIAADLQQLASADDDLADEATRHTAVILARELAALGLDLPLEPGQIIGGEWATEAAKKDT